MPVFIIIPAVSVLEAAFCFALICLKKEGMAKKNIVIDGYIGPFAYSKQFIREMLKDSQDDEVELLVSSLGGRVDHALDIHDQLANHGNVTVKYAGFNASAATFLSMGAKKILISENSFYLVHKVMSGVDIYGAYNEDDLDSIIEKLQKEKDENKKMDMQIAVMYARKSGKAIKDIIGLMKKDTWITAREALDWGFVDEIITATKQENLLEDFSKVAMISASGLPMPIVRTENPHVQQPQINEESLFEKLWNRLTYKQKELRQNSPKNKEMEKQFLNVNKVLDVEKLESGNDGIYLDESQLESIDNQFALNGTELQAANSAKDAAVRERDAARANLTNTLAVFDAIDVSVKEAGTAEAKANAVRILLAAKPGTPPAGAKGSDNNNSNNADADWGTIDSLPHNREVDENN